MAKRTKKESKKENQMNNIFAKISGILAGSGLIIFSICLVLGMIGYNPADESFNVSNSKEISNFMGRFGSYSADFIVNSFGLAIFIFLIPVVVWGYLLIKHQKILEFKIRLLAVFVGIVPLAGIFYQLFPNQLRELKLLGEFSHLLPEALMNLFKSWKMEGYEAVIAIILQALIAVMSFNLAVGITFKQWGRALKSLGKFIVVVLKKTGIFISRLCKPRALTENQTYTTSNVRKEPTLSAMPEDENEDVVISPIETKETVKPKKESAKKSAEVIPIAPKATKEDNGYKFPDINLLSRPKEKLGLNINEKELSIGRCLRRIWRTRTNC